MPEVRLMPCSKLPRFVFLFFLLIALCFHIAVRHNNSQGKGWRLASADGPLRLLVLCKLLELTLVTLLQWLSTSWPQESRCCKAKVKATATLAAMAVAIALFGVGFGFGFILLSCLGCHTYKTRRRCAED